MVVGFIASLNVILTEVFVATPVAPSAGEVEVTVGDVVSGATPVVKVQEKSPDMAFPARSLTPVVTLAVKVAE
jgi:hypothetical protein